MVLMLMIDDQRLDLAFSMGVIWSHGLPKSIKQFPRSTTKAEYSSIAGLAAELAWFE